MKFNSLIFLLALFGFFGTGLSGCKPSRQAYYFKNSASAYTSAFRAPDSTVKKEIPKLNFKPKTVVAAIQKGKEQAPEFSGIITALKSPERLKPLMPGALNGQPALANKIMAPSVKQATLQPINGPTDSTLGDDIILLIAALLLIFSIILLILAIINGGLMAYLMALASFLFTGIIPNMILERESAFHIILAILGIAFFVTALGFGIHYLLISPAIYSVLTLAGIILLIFTWKIIKHYRKKAHAAKQ